MGTFIELIPTPTGYSLLDTDDANYLPVWSPLEQALDVTGYETIDVEILVYSLVESVTITFLTATTKTEDTTLWSVVNNKLLNTAPSTDETAEIVRLTIGETTDQPLFRFLRWRLDGNSAAASRVLLTVRGIGRAG